MFRVAVRRIAVWSTVLVARIGMSDVYMGAISVAVNVRSVPMRVSVGHIFMGHIFMGDIGMGNV